MRVICKNTRNIQNKVSSEYIFAYVEKNKKMYENPQRGNCDSITWEKFFFFFNSKLRNNQVSLFAYHVKIDSDVLVIWNKQDIRKLNWQWNFL